MRARSSASDAALGLIASANPADVVGKIASGNTAGLAVGAAVLTVAAIGAGVYFIHKACVHLSEETHREKIEAIEKLFESTLGKIVVDNSHAITLPPIFKKTVDEDGKVSYDTMHLTDEQVENIACDAYGASVDASIVPYREEIINAINKLKDYYFFHTDKKDVTAQVILYLMQVYQQMLLFEGSDYDESIAKSCQIFIEGYIALAGGMKSLHGGLLSPVYSDTGEAIKYLEQHKEICTQGEIINDLSGDLRGSIHYFTTQLAKLTVAPIEKEWKMLGRASMSQLASGVYHEAYKTRVALPFGGRMSAGPFGNHDASMLEKSTVSKALMELSAYYNRAINFVHVPEIPSRASFQIAKIEPNIADNLRSIFSSSAAVKKEGATASEEDKLFCDLITKVAQFNHTLINFLVLLNTISKIISNKGNEEVDNPHHCIRLYILFDQYRKSIDEESRALCAITNAIDELNGKPARDPHKGDFVRGLIKNSESIRKIVDEKSLVIANRRAKFQSALPAQLSGVDNVSIAQIAQRLEESSGFSAVTEPAQLQNTVSTTEPFESAHGEELRSHDPFIPHPSESMHQNEPIAQVNHIPAAIAPAPVVRIQTFRFLREKYSDKKHIEIIEEADKKSANVFEKLLWLMQLGISDYAGFGNRFAFVEAMAHPRHHNKDAANEFLKGLSASIKNINTFTDDQRRQLVQEKLDELVKIKSESKKPEGEFGKWVDCIQEHCAQLAIVTCFSPVASCALSAA